MEQKRRSSGEDNDLLRLLWEDRGLCTIRTVCSIAVAFGAELTKAQVEELVRRRRKVTGIFDTYFGPDDNLGLEQELLVVNGALDYLRKETNAQIPNPIEQQAHGLKDAVRLRERGRVHLKI